MLPIKQYGEVHVEIQGGSQIRTVKFTLPYGEVHRNCTGKFTKVLGFEGGKYPAVYVQFVLGIERWSPSRGLYPGLTYGEVHKITV